MLSSHMATAQLKEKEARMVASPSRGAVLFQKKNPGRVPTQVSAGRPRAFANYSPETNMSLEHEGFFEDYFPFEMVPFQGTC